MSIQDKLDFLQIQEVTTDKQKANGTREFKLPVNDPHGDAIHVASYNTGYVRRTKTNGRSDWQLNKTYKEKEYVHMDCPETGRQVIRTFENTKRKLILDEQERLEYLTAFCLKNYYIGQANMLSNGSFIPKLKHEDELKSLAFRCNPEVKVIINGHRYNIV